MLELVFDMHGQSYNYSQGESYERSWWGRLGTETMDGSMTRLQQPQRGGATGHVQTALGEKWGSSILQAI